MSIHPREMDPDDLISFTEAARKIGCSRATLYRAASDGRLNDMEVGGRQMLVKDEAWEAFEPNLVGRRAQKLDEQADGTDGNAQ
jgi:excisionase family DNA binding protein